MWAIPNTTPPRIRTRHLFPPLLRSPGFNIWCVWHVEFLPALLFFLTISLYTKAGHARHLPKSAANFKLKGKQKKKKIRSRNQQDLWIVNLLKDTPNVEAAAETPSRLQTWVHHRLYINHLRRSICTQPSFCDCSRYQTERGTSAGLTSQQLCWKQRSRMQTMCSRSSPEIRLHSAYHTGHSGLLTTPHHQV